MIANYRLFICITYHKIICGYTRVDAKLFDAGTFLANRVIQVDECLNVLARSHRACGPDDLLFLKDWLPEQQQAQGDELRPGAGEKPEIGWRLRAVGADDCKRAVRATPYYVRIDLLADCGPRAIDQICTGGVVDISTVMKVLRRSADA